MCIINHFRITAYNKQKDYSIIIESKGMFEKLWQFSSHLVQKGLTILEVGNVKDQISVNLTKSDIHGAKMILKAIASGKPEYDTQVLDGRTRKVIKVNDKIYMV